MLPHSDLPTSSGARMSAKPASLRVAAVGDLHVHQNSDESLKALFEKISRTADVLALCGDLTHLGLPEEADKLVNDLRACRIPVVAVLGNHDYQSGRQEDVKRSEEHTSELQSLAYLV